jgi:hypothetical protein
VADEAEPAGEHDSPTASAFDLAGLDDADRAARARSAEADRQALRDSLHFDDVDAARPLWPRRPPGEVERLPRSRSRRSELVTTTDETPASDDALVARLDVLTAAVEALADRMSRAGRVDPGSLAAAPRRSVAESMTDAGGLADRLRALEARLDDRDELFATQLQVIGNQLSAVQGAAAGAFVAADVDQLRTRLERISAELVSLRGEVRASLEHTSDLAAQVVDALEPGMEKMLDAISGLDAKRLRP